MIRNMLNKLGTIRVAFVASVGFPLFIASSAYAQNPAPAPAGEAVAERVIVTGSNIPTAEEQASIPVTTYTAQWLQKSGANTPTEGLRQLPTVVGNAATENDSNAGDGTANVNLRGIGAVNTLVLINGRRAALGNGFPDVNLIPISAIEKVDILKDGASAIYGSDAVAGVVNFMFFNDVRDYSAPYEGAEFEVRYGTTTDHDANVRQAWIRGGVTGLDGKVAIFASAEYYNRAAIMSADRTISVTGDTSNNPGIEVNPPIGVTALGLGGINNNSPTFAGRVNLATGPSPNGQYVLLDLSNNAPTGVASYRPFDNPSGTDVARFNFRAFTPAIPAMEKSLTYVTGRYKIFGDALQVYGDMMYTHERQKNGLAGAPFAITNDFNGLTEATASPFNPFGANLTQVRYRLQQELGDRLSTFDKDYWRWVMAAKGDFDFAGNDFISHLGYDAGLVYERFEEEEIDSGDAQRSLLLNEIAANNFDIFIGQNAPPIGSAPTFVDGVPTGTTAPYNNVAAAQRASYIGHSFFRNKNFQWDITLNAHLFPSLWNGGIDVAGGYVHEWRQDQQIGDPVQAAGDQLGFNAVPNAKFNQKVNSYFGEIKIPFVTSTMNVPFVNFFEVDYAYRFEKFDDTDLTNPGAHLSGSFDNGGTNRVTVGYRPIPDVLLRGTWGESFRSPRPADLFFPTFQDFPVVFDPVKVNTLQPPEGVWIRGNPQLKPEVTTNWTAGLVYSPKFVPGFTLTADWYQIYTTNLILNGEQFAQVLLTQGVVDPDGFGNGSGAAEAPGGTGLGITRDSFGNLIAIDSVSGNAGTRFVQGLDVQTNYQLPTTNFGQFTFTLGWNHFFTWKASPGPGLGFNDFLGNYNNGRLPLAPGAIPFNKGFARLEWEYKLGPGKLDFVAQGNYIGDYEDDPAFILGNVIISPPGAVEQYQLHRRVTDYMTLDLQCSYEFVKPPMEAPVPGYAKEGKDAKSVVSKEVAAPVETGSLFQRMLWGTKITGGVLNAFDRQPPTVLGAFNDNYDTSLYSIRDRFWYIALSKKF